MLMYLPVMHCSKMREDGESEVTGREVGEDMRRQDDQTKWKEEREEGDKAEEKTKKERRGWMMRFEL